MSGTSEYLTQEKYDELTRELKELKTLKRKEVAEHLEYAKSLGDLSENAEYHEARENQANVEDRISKLEAILVSAVIVSPHHSDAVDVGSTVRVEKKKDKTKHIFKIVGSEESNLTAGKLSVSSPLGSAMVGKKKGYTFSVETPSGMVEYAITEIE